MSHQSNTRTKRERVEYLNPQRGTDRPLCGDGRLHHRRGKWIAPCAAQAMWQARDGAKNAFWPRRC